MTLSIPDIIPESKHKFLDEITKNFVQNEQGIFEIEIVRKDGALVPVEVNAHLFYLQGKPVVLAITRDITERKRTETAIREAHQRLENILEFLPDPVFVLDTGEGYRMEPAMEELTAQRRKSYWKGRFAYSVAFITKTPFLADYILNRDETILLRHNNPSIDGDRVTADVQTLHPVTKAGYGFGLRQPYLWP